MNLSIKYHPSISSEMVNFVCYIVTSINMSEFLTPISTVKYLQRSDKINLAKQEVKLKNLESFNTEAEKSIKNFKGEAGI